MTALIDMYRKELSGIAEYARDTVDTYVSCMVMFFEFGKGLGIDPLLAKGTHIIKWISTLQSKGLSSSRLEQHRAALRFFFALMVKRKILMKNPVDRLPPSGKSKPRTGSNQYPRRSCSSCCRPSTKRIGMEDAIG